MKVRILIETEVEDVKEIVKAVYYGDWAGRLTRLMIEEDRPAGAKFETKTTTDVKKQYSDPHIKGL